MWFNKYFPLLLHYFVAQVRCYSSNQRVAGWILGPTVVRFFRHSCKMNGLRNVSMQKLEKSNKSTRQD